MPNPSLYQSFQAAVGKFGDAIAIRSETGDLTYPSLEAASREVGAALIGLGIAHGDRVSIWGVNSAEWAVAALGIQAAGGVLVPIGTRLRGREAAGILADSGTRVIFCDARFGDFSYVEALLAQDLPGLEKIVLLNGDGPADARVTDLAALRRTGAALDQAALDARIAMGSGDDLADIIFTSGTTGRPKGVPMTHAQSIVACEDQQAEITFFEPGDVFAVSFPFAHNAGYRAGWQISLLYGVRILPVATFDPSDLLRMIAREAVTHLPAPPPIVRGILDHPELANTDISSIKMISTGGTTVPVQLIEDMRSVFGANTVQTGYGLTETAGSVTVTHMDDPAEVISRTVGHALSRLEVKIVGPDHAELPDGEVGEIAVRGFQVLNGYYNNPEATAAAFTADGFLLTGDAGSRNAEGNIAITDRIKDMYLVGGFNCYPAEIEHVLRTMPGIANAAVIGIPDERLGEVGRAFIIRQPGATIEEKDVIAWARDEMANYKVPRSVRFLDALPLNATGKVAKTELRALD